MKIKEEPDITDLLTVSIKNSIPGFVATLPFFQIEKYQFHLLNMDNLKLTHHLQP
ncbi:hypothetical protein [Flavobacterium pectinovorum]|uniref:hypothetical protein n=1 Tax=Flavobacterium pectinovorum TaxID=29533 RepID=UPI0019D51F85|nr:hypothetical protein [Flavobacterium pectinovorum]